MSIRALLRLFREQPRGQSFVEFALILPVFLVIMSAAIDLGRIAYARVTIANVAREASFQAAQTPTLYLAGQPCTSGNEEANKVICRAILESTGSVITVTPADVTLTCNLPDGNVDPSCGEGMGHTVTVTATGRFNLLTPVMGAFFGGQTVTFSSTSLNQIASLPSNDAALPPPPPVTTIVPASLIGMAEGDVAAALAAANLTPGTRTEAYDFTYPAGTIASVTPSVGTQVTVGSVVDYVVSKGPAPVFDCSTVSAGFTATKSPSSGKSPVDVTVTDTTTYNPACVTVWVWNWGDGGPATTGRVQPAHRYYNYDSRNVTYTISLTVTSGTFTSTFGGVEIMVKP